jgi:hypothetical protein
VLLKTAITKVIDSFLVNYRAYMSIDGIRWDVPVFRGKNRLLLEIYRLLFEGHLRKVSWLLLCECINPQEILQFVADSSVMGLDSQRVKIH